VKFGRIFFETQVKNNAVTERILSRYSNIPRVQIAKVEDVFGKVRKPYLHKRTGLNLFIGRKEGSLVKEAPDAYGLSNGRHFYFIYAHNCIYECEYCYLQGYFDSPDIVLFVNYEEMLNEMSRLCKMYAEETVWFHAGEFSDSLALGHLTGEWPWLWRLASENSNARLELRTKSANVTCILDLEPVENIMVSYSLSPQSQIENHDRKTPSLPARLRAIEKLVKRGFQIAIHLDPVIIDYVDDYPALVSKLAGLIPPEQMAYISIGVVRFTPKVHKEVMANYGQSQMLAADFVSSFDHKLRYHRPIRLKILRQIQRFCFDNGIAEEKVYLCMEKV